MLSKDDFRVLANRVLRKISGERAYQRLQETA
jgi:hypothetical protein